MHLQFSIFIIFTSFHFINIQRYRNNIDYIFFIFRKFRTPLTPPFAFDMVKGWVDDFAFYANRLMNYWHEKVQQGKSTVDLLYWLPVFTLDVLGHTAFSYDFKAINYESDDNLKALQYVLHAFEDKVQMMVLVVRSKLIILINKS